jgi:hypothetical protein
MDIACLIRRDNNRMPLFRVRAILHHVNGDCSQPVSFSVRAANKDDVKRQVTPEFYKKNVTDDVGGPIRTIRILRIDAMRRAGS